MADRLEESLVAAARYLAASLLAGGRLLAEGDGRAAADARHIAVEFVHPVTVGRRALPALVGSSGARPGDVVVGVAYDGSGLPGRVDLALADRPVPGAGHVVSLPVGDADAAKEAAVTAYHVLWELTHVFLEQAGGTGSLSGALGASGASGLSGASGPSADLEALYPMLYQPPAREPPELAATSSARAKVVESADLRRRCLAQHDDLLAKAGELVAAAPTVFTFGNGGSATDAADLAWRIGPRARAVSDDIATITAVANDVSFDVVFARQLSTLGQPGDVAIGLSTSGNSPNVLAGLAEAARRGLRTIGLAGYEGGGMASAALDVCLVVPSSSVHRIQEAQVSLYNELTRRAAHVLRQSLPGPG
jgi:D-sedoheptulose 7-phosphate isomerase